MATRMRKFIGISVGLSAACGIGVSAMGSPPKSPEIAPARDGNIAIAEELCAARKAGTLAAYDLFIARHPAHPLADAARKERGELLARSK
jgi:hypothetical protein